MTTKETVRHKTLDGAKVIGEFEMPSISCYADIKQAQEVLGMDNTEFYLAIWRGLRFHVNCKIRQEYIDKI